MRITILTDKQQQAAEKSELKMKKSLIGKVIRETARAMGHGDERISWDGGINWHAKKGIRCSGSDRSLKVEAPDGSWIMNDVWHLIDRRHNEAMRTAEDKLMEIADAMREETLGSSSLTHSTSFISSADWLWCTIMMTDGDVIL